MAKVDALPTVAWVHCCEGGPDKISLVVTTTSDPDAESEIRHTKQTAQVKAQSNRRIATTCTEGETLANSKIFKNFIIEVLDVQTKNSWNTDQLRSSKMSDTRTRVSWPLQEGSHVSKAQMWTIQNHPWVQNVSLSAGEGGDTDGKNALWVNVVIEWKDPV